MQNINSNLKLKTV